MKQIDIENELRHIVSQLVVQVELAAAQGRQDINVVSEDAWIPILAEVFNCPNLENLNNKSKNFPGIDLGDETERVAFQVTATTSLTKVKDTIQKVIDHKLFHSFDEVYVFTLINKQMTYSQSAIDKITGDRFSFDTKKHIIDPSDVLSKIKNLRVRQQEKILRYFRSLTKEAADNAGQLDIEKPAPQLLVSNMVSVEIPSYVYVAELLPLDKKTIIKEATDELNFKRKSASKRTLVSLALKLSGDFSTNWTYFENKIFTFRNLEDDPLPDSLIDIGTIERLDSVDLSEHEKGEYHNLFKELLQI